MPTSSGEKISLQELETLPTPDRVSILLDTYKGDNLTPVAFRLGVGEVPIDQPENFPVKPAYISVRATRQTESGREQVILTEPRSFEPNMVRRLRRSINVRYALSHPQDTADYPEGLIRHFRFPEVLGVIPLDHPTEGRWVRSTMERYIESKPVGSVYLADPDGFTEKDLQLMVRFHKYFQDATQQFAFDDDDFYHRYISNPFRNHGEGVRKEDTNKWWLDYDDRKAALTEIYGPQFVRDQGKLLESPATAALFGKRVCVIGNVIPAVLGRTADGSILFKTMERTAYAEFLAFDDATFLATLVSSPEQAIQYMRFALRENPTRLYYEHLRGSIIFDKAGNLLGIKDAIGAARQTGNPHEVSQLENAFNNLKTFVEDALNQRNAWSPEQYYLT